MSRYRLLVPMVLLVLAAACSDDEPATAPSDEPERACEPVGTELAADATATVDIDLSEYGFAPATPEVEAGVVTFRAVNNGEEAHELAFLPGGGDVPFAEPGSPDEDALSAAGAFELEGFSPDQTCEATYALEAGTYTLFCIVEAEDGETHYEKGMRGTLTVS